MADFRARDLTTIKSKLPLLQLKSLMLSEYPFESGGLIDLDFKIDFFPSVIKNCHVFDPPVDFFVKLIRKSYLCSFHSHLNAPTPSKEDLFFIKNYEIPLIIYSLNWNCFLSVNIQNETRDLTWLV